MALSGKNRKGPLRTGGGQNPARKKGMTFCGIRSSIPRMILNVSSDSSGEGNNDPFEREVELIMEAFDPRFKEALEQQHPEWQAMAEKVRIATGILKEYEVQADFNILGPIEYADWCYYPEPDHTISNLAIYADIMPARTDRDRKTQEQIIRETETALQPLQFSTIIRGNILTILIPLAANKL